MHSIMASVNWGIGGGMPRMNDQSPIPEPSPEIPKKPKKPRKPRTKKAAPQKQTEIEGGTVGKRGYLTRATRTKLIAALKDGIASGVHPESVKAGCIQKFKVSGQTAEQYLRIVQQETLKQTGDWRSQVQEITQKALMTIVQKKGGNDSNIIRACGLLDNMFDLRMKPEEDAAAESEVVNEALQRMDQMSVQELSVFAEQLRHNGLTAEALFSPWAIPSNENKEDRVKIRNERRRRQRNR